MMRLSLSDQEPDRERIMAIRNGVPGQVAEKRYRSRCLRQASSGSSAIRTEVRRGFGDTAFSESRVTRPALASLTAPINEIATFRPFDLLLNECRAVDYPRRGLAIGLPA
jgi:hypothetical protein